MKKKTSLMMAIMLVIATLVISVPNVLAPPFHGASILKNVLGPGGTYSAQEGDTVTAYIRVINTDDFGCTLTINSISDVVHHASGDVATGNLLAAPVLLTFKGDYVEVEHSYVVEIGDNDPLYDSASTQGVDPVVGSFTLSYPGLIDIIYPLIDVEKYVWDGDSYEDADVAPGPSIPSTTNVLFKFTIHNIGNVALTGVTLSDVPVIGTFYTDEACTVPAVFPTSLALDQTKTFYAKMTWAIGSHLDTATATDVPTGVTDSDPANYFGTNPCVDVEKYVWDGAAYQDADTAPGPTILSTATVLFKFTIHNCGNVPLTNVVLTDTPAIATFYTDEACTIPATFPTTLTVDQTKTYYAKLPWAVGQQTDNACVSTAEGANDCDPANYFGEEQGGCTLTWGYWKTHSKYGPAPHDETWDCIGEDTPFFGSGYSYYGILQVPPKGGNAYIILAHQYIAAVLNGCNNDNSLPSGVQDWLYDAHEFFDGDLTLTRAEVISLAGSLANFNEGYYSSSWPHCD